MSKTYYPVFLQVHGRRCLVVGGGDVAARKAASLVECAASVHVVSPRLSPELAALANAGTIAVSQRPYEPADTVGAGLVIAATDNADVNRQVALDCRENNIPVNVVDAPELCDFIVPAVIRRGPLTIAVSTAGTLPAMAKKIRETLENEFDQAYGELLEALGAARTRVLRDVPDAARRKQIFSRLAAEDLLSLLREQGHSALESRIATIIREE